MLPTGGKLVTFLIGLSLGAVMAHFIHLATVENSYEISGKHASHVKLSTGKVSTPVPGKNLTPLSCPTDPGIKMPTGEESEAATKMQHFPAKLFKRVRILCLILTHAKNFKTRATAVNNTWARRCNRHVFVAANFSSDLPLIHPNITDDYGNLWQKVWMSLELVYRQFNLSEFDYVLKADDDTYVVMENLRLLLFPLDPNQPSHLGRQFIYDKDENQRYMSGGAGYVLSRGAVKLFVEEAVHKKGRREQCDLARKVSEDWMMGYCLISLGVKLVKSLDSKGLERFHPLNPEYMIGWGPVEIPKWMHTFNYYKFKACLSGCISRVTTTFHYIENMYLVEFLLYGMRPVGTDPTVSETADLYKRL